MFRGKQETLKQGGRWWHQLRWSSDFHVPCLVIRVHGCSWGSVPMGTHTQSFCLCLFVLFCLCCFFKQTSKQTNNQKRHNVPECGQTQFPINFTFIVEYQHTVPKSHSRSWWADPEGTFLKGSLIDLKMSAATVKGWALAMGRGFILEWWQCQYLSNPNLKVPQSAADAIGSGNTLGSMHIKLENHFIYQQADLLP